MNAKTLEGDVVGAFHPQPVHTIKAQPHAPVPLQACDEPATATGGQLVLRSGTGVSDGSVPLGVVTIQPGRGKHWLRFHPEGDVVMDGRLLTTDMEIVTGLRALLTNGGDQERAGLADKLQAAEDTNRDLLAENARLRRRVEELERKGKR